MKINKSQTCPPKIGSIEPRINLVGAYDQNCSNRKRIKIEALFSDWKTIVQISKSDLHRSDWRSMSQESLIQISGQSAHKRSRIIPLMKSGQWRKNCVFLFKNDGSPLLSLFLLPPLAAKIGRRRRRNDFSSNPFILRPKRP